MSNETKFTPGPWFHSGKPSGYDWCDIKAPKAEGVTVTVATINHWNPEVNDANAALIAAAPELYAALAAYDKSFSADDDARPVDFTLIRAGKSALKKARGEIGEGTDK